MDNIANTIEARMNVLFGQPISSFNMVAGMLCLHFGELHEHVLPGKPSGQIGSWMLHVQCPWRFELQGAIYVGCDDLWGVNSSESAPAEEGDGKTKGTLSVARINGLFGNRTGLDHSHTSSDFFIVKKVSANEFGDVRIDLLSGLCFTLFSASYVGECWRFFSRKRDGKHLVVEGGKCAFN
jgi:hypothetical protein